jgi:hypothetical protein
MNKLELVPVGKQVELGGKDKMDTLYLVDSQVNFFLESIAQKGVFEYVSGDISFLETKSAEDELRNFLKLVFASLKDSGKIEVGVNISMDSTDKLKTYLKVTGF